MNDVTLYDSIKINSMNAFQKKRTIRTTVAIDETPPIRLLCLSLFSKLNVTGKP
jgi:hypothetical protein